MSKVYVNLEHDPNINILLQYSYKCDVCKSIVSMLLNNNNDNEIYYYLQQILELTKQMRQLYREILYNNTSTNTNLSQVQLDMVNRILIYETEEGEK